MATPFPTESLDTEETRPAQSQESTAALVRRLIDELATLFRQELQLATAEFTSAFGKFAASVGSIVTGAAVLYAGVLVLLASAVLGLAQVVEPWLAALIVGGATVALGAIMVTAGAKSADLSMLIPKRSVRSLRRDQDTLTRKNS